MLMILYNMFIKYRLPNWERNSNTILFPIPYQSILSIFISSKQSKLLAIDKIEKYIKKNGIGGTLIVHGIMIINMASFITVIGVLKAVH